MKFNICGTISLQGQERKFNKDVEAKSANHAKQTVYAEFGSSNGIKQSNVKITSIKKSEW